MMPHEQDNSVCPCPVCHYEKMSDIEHVGFGDTDASMGIAICYGYGDGTSNGGDRDGTGFSGGTAEGYGYIGGSGMARRIHYPRIV